MVSVKVAPNAVIGLIQNHDLSFYEYNTAVRKSVFVK